MRIHELHYSNTNTYLIEGEKGKLLFDTGWAGTLSPFCKACKDAGVAVQDIDYILISHFHPDHMGIAQEIADMGATILVADAQKDFLHAADDVLAKEKNSQFVPIADDKVRLFSLNESRGLLGEIGLDGQVLYTPGHSDDSISLFIDDGSLFVGDLNPLYELELHKCSVIGDSWEKLLKLDPKTVYYGHAKTTHIGECPKTDGGKAKYELVSSIMKYIDKGLNIDRIAKKTGADRQFIEDVMRMYLTHTDVGVQGILDRIEIKNR